MIVMDCVANEVKFDGLDELAAAAKCGELGGNERGYYILPDLEVKPVIEIDTDKNIGGLFG